MSKPALRPGCLGSLGGVMAANTGVHRASRVIHLVIPHPDPFPPPTRQQP